MSRLAITTISAEDGLRLAPAHMRREWQDATHEKFANRCLPLLMANSIGWSVEVTHAYRVSCMAGEISVNYDARPEPVIRPLNHFHHGVVTWQSPWLFRTPPGWDLFVLPPLNVPLPDGVTPLSGLVETDHSHESFTFNYRLRNGAQIEFKPGQPLATLLPFPTDTLVEWTAEFTGDPVPEAFTRWSQSRANFNATNQDPKAWQKNYWQAAKRRKIRLPILRKD